MRARQRRGAIKGLGCGGGRVGAGLGPDETAAAAAPGAAATCGTNAAATRGAVVAKSRASTNRRFCAVRALRRACAEATTASEDEATEPGVAAPAAAGALRSDRRSLVCRQQRRCRLLVVGAQQPQHAQLHLNGRRHCPRRASTRGPHRDRGCRFPTARAAIAASRRDLMSARTPAEAPAMQARGDGDYSGFHLNHLFSW